MSQPTRVGVHGPGEALLSSGSGAPVLLAPLHRPRGQAKSGQLLLNASEPRDAEGHPLEWFLIIFHALRRR